LRNLIAAKGYRPRISVDGNVSFDHAPKFIEAGADILVCGSSSIFNRRHGGIVDATSSFRQLLNSPAALSRTDI
jgi:ribulose-phosphate 3-epimerase